MRLEKLDKKMYIAIFINLLIFIIVLSYVFFGYNKDIITRELSSANCFWIPSSIMQSVAAIYAVFIAIFLLTFQRTEIKISSVADVLKPAFENVSYIIITTILFNGLLLFVLNYFNSFDTRIETILIFSLISLFISLFSIVSVSFKILSNTVGLKTPEEFLIQIEEDEDKLKLYTEPDDEEGKKAFQAKKLRENMALSAINLQENETDKLVSYIKSDIYKENELVETYLEIFKTHETPAIRARTAKLFGKTKIEKSVRLLIKALDDKDEHVRRISAEALGEIKNVMAVEHLIQALNIDNNALVRESSAEALGKIKDIRAVDPLIKALKADNSARVRQSSAKALGKIKDIKAVEPLIQALDDNYSGVRWSAVFAIGGFKGEKAVERAVCSIIKKLKDNDHFVRWAAALTLGKIKDVRAVKPLIESLQDDVVRIAAAESIGNILDIDVIDPNIRNSNSELILDAVESLIHIMNNDKKVTVRCKAAEALSKINHLSSFNIFLKGLDDNDLIKYSAVALGKLKDIRAIKPLIKKLNDNDYDYANSEMGKEVPDLSKDMKMYVRVLLAGALGDIGNEMAIEPLMTILNNVKEDENVRRAAGMALRKINGEDWFWQFLTERPDIYNLMVSQEQEG